MVFKKFNLKLEGMRKAQDFVIYPYDGGDTVILQSDTRMMRLHLKTGKALLSKSRSNGSYGVDLLYARGAYDIEMPKEYLTQIQEYLWNNSGKHTYKGVLSIENKELFSQ